MARRLQGTVVAITGGARGIGLATARRLVDAGALVAVGDVDADALEAARRTLGPTAFVGPLDVTDRASFSAFLDAAADALGPLDVLVNNAGMMPIGPFHDEPDAITRKQVDVNVHGVLLGMKLALERFLVAGGGHIVNVASMAGIVPGAGLVTYTGTKHAVMGITEAAHYEYEGRGIKLTAVLPAFVNTALTSGTKPGFGVPKLEPEDVADLVVRAIRRPKVVVLAPPTLGYVPLLRALTPMPVRTVLNKAMGLDTVFLDFDKDARRAYDERISR